MGDHRLTRIKLLVVYCIEPLLWTDNSYNDTNNYVAYCIFGSISTSTSTWRVCIFCLSNSMDTYHETEMTVGNTIRTYTSSRAEYLCRSEKMPVAIKYFMGTYICGILVFNSYTPENTLTSWMLKAILVTNIHFWVVITKHLMICFFFEKQECFYLIASGAYYV